MKKVAIIGSGTAGAALALMLHKSGEYKVEVFERETNPKPIGSGILLQLTGVKILSDLGLGEKLNYYGEPIKGFEGREKDGKKLFDLDFLKHSGKTGLGISRGALFSLLHEALDEHNITLYKGHEIVQIASHGENASIYTKTGQLYEGYNLIVAASGASSVLRENILETKVSKRQKWAAIWTKIPYPDDVFDGKISHVYKGTKRFLGFMPIGRAYGKEDVKMVNVFWSVRFDKGKELIKKGKAHFKQTLIDFAPEYREILQRIDEVDEDEIVLAPYYDSKISPQFHKRIAFIGDIAHAMSPQLSQGASFALLDAKSLAESLFKYKDTKTALKHFYKKRRTQINYYYYTSKITTSLYQSDKKIAWIRNTFLSWLLKIPFFANIVTETVLGYRKGLFTKLNKDQY